MKRRAFAPWLDQTNDVIATFISAAGRPDLINLAGGLPDPQVWPVDALSELAEEAIRLHPEESLAYGPNPGLPRLRDTIAKRLSTVGSGGTLNLTRDNVLITTGGTQALACVGAALLSPGQTIAAQSPTYLGALDAWRTRAPQYRPMVLEAEGFDATEDMAQAQFAYTVPNFSNPSGRLVPLEQRHALLAAARKTGCWLVEDDPYGALYYDGEPLPSLLELSAENADPTKPYDGPVVHLGTVSKMLAPGLRIGWIVAAPEMIKALSMAKLGMDMFSSGVCQVVSAKALERGLADDNREATCALYRARRDALCDALDTHASDLFQYEKPRGGMFVWVRARNAQLDTDALMQTALAHGVCISPSSVFDPEEKDRSGMRLNFTLNDEAKLEEGIRRLARATREALRAAA
jgi:2-aminoadipate transaminase